MRNFVGDGAPALRLRLARVHDDAVETVCDPEACSTAGLTGGVVIEVKDGQQTKTASDALVASWLAEAETERGNAGAAVAFIVTQRPGVGAPNAQR